MGRAHADSAAWHRIVLHGGDRSFSGAVLRALVAENAVFLLYRCRKTDKRRRFSVCGHVHCTCRNGRYGQHRGRGNRADARRSGRGALAVGERLCRNDDGFCGEHTRDALPRAGSGRQLARRSHAVPEKRSAQSAIGGSLCAVLCAGIVRYRQHEPVQLNRAGTFRLVRHTERDRRRGDSGFARRGASRRPQTAVPRDGNTRAVHGAVLHGRRGRCAVGASSESAAGVRADLFDGVRYKGRHRRRTRLRHDAGRPGGCVARHIFK